MSLKFDVEDLLPPSAIFSATPDELDANLQFLFENRDRIVAWAAEWKSFYSNTISPTSIGEWVLQHTRPDAVRAAMSILETIRFVSDPSVSQTLKQLIETLPPSTQQARFYQPGGLQDSSGVVGYSLAKELGIPEAQLASRVLKSMDRITASDTALIMLDDNIASGTQTIDTLCSWLGLQTTGEIDPSPLPKEIQALLGSIEFHWLFVVALGDGPQRLKSRAQELGLKVSVHCGESIPTDAFHLTGGAARSRAVITMASIGRMLNQAKETWDDEKRFSHCLGHGNLGKGVVFAHNAPKNLLTTLWRFGHHRFGSWLPLFPEREEWRLHRQAIEVGHPYLRHLVQLVLSGKLASQGTKLELALILDQQVVDSIVTLEAGSIEEEFAPLVPNWIDRLMPPAMKLAEPQDSKWFLDFVGGAPIPVTNAEVEGYNNRLVRYKEQLAEYRIKTRSSLEEISRSFEAGLRLKNVGTKMAESIVVGLNLPSGATEANAMLSSPPKAPERPKPRGFQDVGFVSIPDGRFDPYPMRAGLLGPSPLRDEEPTKEYDSMGKLVQLWWKVSSLRQEMDIVLECPELTFAEGEHLLRLSLHGEDMPRWERSAVQVSVSRGGATRSKVKDAVAELVASRPHR